MQYVRGRPPTKGIKRKLGLCARACSQTDCLLQSCCFCCSISRRFVSYALVLSSWLPACALKRHSAAMPYQCLFAARNSFLLARAILVLPPSGTRDGGGAQAHATYSIAAVVLWARFQPITGRTAVATAAAGNDPNFLSSKRACWTPRSGNLEIGQKACQRKVHVVGP